jgi:hypothetical protein
MIDTGAMTNLIETTLEGSPADLLVGDGIAPLEGGWTLGTPNLGGFAAYTVLAFDGATPINPDVAKAEPEWSTRWAMRHHGGSREQADWVALVSRSRLTQMLQKQFGVDPFKVIGVQWNQLGAMSRNDSVDPPFWTASDSVILVVSRVRISTP